MDHVLAIEVDWIKRDTPPEMTIRSAIPSGFDVYGLLDIDTEERPDEDRLLAALDLETDEQLVAGWILRNGSVTEAGDEHLLYANWRYRCRHVTAADLTGRTNSDDNGFPDLLFPADHRWLISTLWDDTWRSIGLSTKHALTLEQAQPTFERIDPATDISTTGRHVY